MAASSWPGRAALEVLWQRQVGRSGTLAWGCCAVGLGHNLGVKELFLSPEKLLIEPTVSTQSMIPICCASLERQKEPKMTGSKGKRNILKVFKVHFFCICFVKTNKQTNKKRQPTYQKEIISDNYT